MRIRVFELCLALWLGSDLASASGETEAEAALSLGHRGLEAFEARDFGEAARLFASAELRAHSPVFLLYLARSAKELGQLERARTLLREASAEPLTVGSPTAFRRAVDDAEREVAELDAEYRFISIRFDGDFAFPVLASTTKTTTLLVGRLADLALPRGADDVEFTDASGVTMRASPPPPNDAGPWILARPSLARSALGDPNSEQNSPAQRLTTRPSGASPSTPHRPAAYVAFGLGGLSAIIGGIAGTAAWLLARDVRATCDDDGYCPPSERARAEEAGRIANFATVAFVSSGVGVLTGLTLVAVGNSERAARMQVSAVGVRATGDF